MTKCAGTARLFSLVCLEPCDTKAEWVVNGDYEVCSACIATFLFNDAPNIVTPIGLDPNLDEPIEEAV